MDFSKHRAQQADIERTSNLQELTLLTNRFEQLTWCTRAQEQRERAALDTSIMNLYCKVFPRSTHTWHESYDVVMRSGRHLASGPGKNRN
jgi:hypothetical protein